MTGFRGRWVRWLAEGGTRAELGGKGAALARLLAAGLPVPDGFVVTAEAFRAYAGAGSPPVGLAAEVAGAYAVLGGGPVAVRSSGVAEDGATASYAGQYETVLDVTGTENVVAAVERCWRSVRSARAAAYAARQGGGEPGLAVVVQRMAPANAAGVLFTVDPVTGDPSVVTVNAGRGLGEGVVAGEVTADVVEVDRASGRVRTGVVTGARPTLSEGQAERLAALGLRIEALERHPVDVEWARAGDELMVLQARPITVTAEDRDPWNDSRSGDFLWTSTNVGEAIPDVMTPLTWSVAQVYLADAMAGASVPPHRGWGRIGGRVYVNVSVMQALTGAVGLVERPFRALAADVFGSLPPGTEIPPVPVGWPARVRAVGPLAAHVVGEVRRDRRVVEAYLAAHPRLCERRRRQVADAADPAALADLFDHVLEPDYRRVSRMLSASTRSGGAWFVATRLWLRRLVGDAGADALTSGVGGAADGGLASLGLLDGLDQLARGVVDREEFVRRHGHRGPHEFELARPRPAEDPDWVDRQLAARTAGAGPAYADRLVAARRRRDEAWAELVRRHPQQARVLRRALDLWARVARDRERARGEVVRFLGVLRTYALRAGALTGLGDDVFFLDTDELGDVLRGGPVAPEVVAGRRAAYARYSALPPYPVLVRGRFDPYAWAAEGPAGEDGPDRVRGFPGSAGVVEGVVRVVTDAGRADEVEAGEVLVTTVTNVGWTPLFPRLAAVVTDVGAPLSHAAIVARELGLPAVVGCGDATTRLRTGDRVRVDGAAGTVEVLAR